MNSAAVACAAVDDTTSCRDVLAYWQAMRLKHDFQRRLLRQPVNRLLDGERLARELNCFQCHGELGQGGRENVGSLKNYIPGYFGRDFIALTDGGRIEVVREWIRTGSTTEVTDHPLTGWIARLFLEHQAVSMPSFSSLETAELDLVTDYVTALHEFGPLDAQGLIRYQRATAGLPD